MRDGERVLLHHGDDGRRAVAQPLAPRDVEELGLRLVEGLLERLHDVELLERRRVHEALAHHVGREPRRAVAAVPVVHREEAAAASCARAKAPVLLHGRRPWIDDEPNHDDERPAACATLVARIGVKPMAERGAGTAR